MKTLPVADVSCQGCRHRGYCKINPMRLSLAIVLVVMPLPASFGAVLTNAVQVLELSAAQAAHSLPVHLQGVVVDESDPHEHAVILADSSASLYVSAVTNLFAPYHRKDMLDIEGVTSQGQFAPCVVATKVKKTGWTDPPPARPATYQQLITGALDAQYVKLTGVVRQCVPIASSGGTWRIVLAADGGAIPIWIPLPQDPQIEPDAEVTIQAVCLYQFNERRQALSPVLQVPRGVPVIINKLSPANPYDAPVRSAVSLSQYSREIPFGHRVHVRGIVTRAESGSVVWIRDQSSGLRIQVRQTDNLQPGDEIDALGFAGNNSSSPVLEDAVFRKIKTLPPPAPLKLVVAAAAYNHQDDLVSIEATLMDVQPVLNGLALTLEADNTVFKAILKVSANDNAIPAWQPNSQVRVAGICNVIYDNSEPVMGIWHPQTFQILLRSPQDLSILEMPPWWTPRHVIFLLGILTGGLLLVIGIGMMIARRRLNEQARRRATAEAEFSAILSERNRLAREIHDTLAQGLTATSVQLQLAQIRSNDGNDGAAVRHHLELAQQLVRGSLEEARNSIWNMRSQVLETGSLVSALESILKQLADGVIPQTHFEVAGRERRLPTDIENDALRLGQEAIANAVKHARATRINVRLVFGEKNFSLAVTDDGCGFDSARPPAREGGFGLVGMKERAAKLNGALAIHTVPGQGTEIKLSVPLAGG
jgi:signal transduction histidine kinase